MSTSTANLPSPILSASLALDQWQILFHETMAALLRAQEAVKQQWGFWGILNGLWTSSRDLKALNAQLKVISELPDGLLTEEFIHSQIPQVRKLLRSIEDLIDTAKRKGWMNRSLTGAPLGLICSRGEYIADYLETLEMSMDPEVLREISDGRSQIELGQFESMGTLF
jgi:hypothetical protein